MHRRPSDTDNFAPFAHPNRRNSTAKIKVRKMHPESSRCCRLRCRKWCARHSKVDQKWTQNRGPSGSSANSPHFARPGWPMRGGNPQWGDKIANKLRKKTLLPSMIFRNLMFLETLLYASKRLVSFRSTSHLLTKPQTQAAQNQCETAKGNTYMTAQQNTRHC